MKCSHEWNTNYKLDNFTGYKKEKCINCGIVKTTDPKTGQHLNRKLVVCLFGIPNSGKTAVADRISEICSSQHDLLQGTIIPILRLDTEGFREFSHNTDYSANGRINNQYRICDFIDMVENRQAFVLSFNHPTPDIREVLKDRYNAIFVHCDCPQDICESRDIKDIYSAAKAGKKSHQYVSGVNFNFDPNGADMTIDTSINTNENITDQAMKVVRKYLIDWLRPDIEYMI